jgi:hypothetical protein
MKENDARVDFPDHQMVLYVEKADGSYESMQTGSYLTRNYFDDYQGKRARLEETYRGKLLAGQITPVEYYMVLTEMGIGDLSSRVGLSVSKIKRQMTPSGFASMRIRDAQRYADVFGIALSEIFHICEQPASGGRIRDVKTANPFVTKAEFVKDSQ